MTRHEYFVQYTKYQLLKPIRETLQDDLNRYTQLNIFQFSAYLKYSIINNYNPLCNLKKMLCLWLTSLSLDGFVSFDTELVLIFILETLLFFSFCTALQHYYIYNYILFRFTHTRFTLIKFNF